MGVFLFTRDSEVCTTPQPCRAIVTPRWFSATKFQSAQVCNLPQKFPLIFLTSLSLQPREVQREKKHALTTAQDVFPPWCAGCFRTGSKRSKILLVSNQHSHKAKDRNSSQVLNIQAFPGLFFSSLFSYIQTIFNSIWRKKKYLRSYSLHTNTFLVTRISSAGYYSLSTGSIGFGLWQFYPFKIRI